MSEASTNRPGGGWGDQTVGLIGIILLGLLLAAFLGTVLYCIVTLWGGVPLADSMEDPAIAVTYRTVLPILNIRLHMRSEVRLLLIVGLFGALGAGLHAATSFTVYVGNRQFKRSWIPWYMFRPFIGASLALILYAALRGGLLAISAGPEDLSEFGMAAISGLSGMFSKEAIIRLRGIFEQLFNTERAEAAQMADPLKKED